MSRQFKQILCIAGLLCSIATTYSQIKPVKENPGTKNFARITSRSGVVFTLPEGFKEALTTGDNAAYDYGMVIPGQEFEIWLKITAQNENSPDSVYLNVGKNEARNLAGENSYITSSLSPRVLTAYNADAGKSYFISLPDAPSTRHYKFALLITLQKAHKATIMAVCLTNDKGPGFFKNISKANNCIKFKAG